MAFTEWRAKLAQTSVHISTSALASGSKQVRRWATSLVRVVVHKLRTRKARTSPLGPDDEQEEVRRRRRPHLAFSTLTTPAKSLAATAARLAREHGLSQAEAEYYALLHAQQRAQLRLAEMIMQLYLDGELLDGESYLSDTSTLASSDEPATPPPEFDDGGVDVGAMGEDDAGNRTRE